MPTDAPITRFRGSYFFLSNFCRIPIPVIIDGVFFDNVPTSEHAYQAWKVTDQEFREHIISAATPGEAKKIARRLPLRENWDSIRLAVMKRVLDAKFAPDTSTAQLLLATGDAPLIEENTWGDRYWGVSNGAGENWLGRLLMLRRHQLRMDQDVLPY